MAQLPRAGLDAGREALRRLLTGEDDLTSMLTKVALLATETIPMCDLASITTMHRGRPTTPVFTEKVALALDETQYELGDGPCLAAIRHQGTEHVTTSSDERWPPFCSAASEAGVRSTFSVPLLADGMALGGLNLYSRTSDVYDDASRERACEFADQLGVAAANATVYADSYELAKQLREALESRAVIEQAKGIIMAGQRCGPDAAFAFLTKASQNQNRKLRSIAVEVVERYARGERRDDGDHKSPTPGTAWLGTADSLDGDHARRRPVPPPFGA